MERFEMTLQIAEKLANDIDAPFEFIMVMGTIFDYWTDKKGMSIKQAKDLMELLRDTHAGVNDKLGTFSGKH